MEITRSSAPNAPGLSVLDGPGRSGRSGPARLPGAAGTGSVEAGFGDALTDLIGSVNGSSSEANAAIGRMLDGTGDVHEAVIALQKADTMLQLTVQIRNKLVQAYQDIMRMPV
jgi:flagellar hook-basal body complex protein FliE